MKERLVGKERSQPKYLSLEQMSREFVRDNFCRLSETGTRFSTYQGIKKGDYSGVIVGIGMVLESKKNKLDKAFGIRKEKLPMEILYLQHLRETIVNHKDRLKQNLDLTVEDFETPQSQWIDFETNPIFYLNFLRKLREVNPNANIATFWGGSD